MYTLLLHLLKPCLYHLCPEHLREAIEGDLEEEFNQRCAEQSKQAAQHWLIQQQLRSLFPLFWMQCPILITWPVAAMSLLGLMALVLWSPLCLWCLSLLPANSLQSLSSDLLTIMFLSLEYLGLIWAGLWMGVLYGKRLQQHKIGILILPLCLIVFGMGVLAWWQMPEGISVWVRVTNLLLTWPLLRLGVWVYRLSSNKFVKV